MISKEIQKYLLWREGQEKPASINHVPIPYQYKTANELNSSCGDDSSRCLRQIQLDEDSEEL